MSYDVIIGTFDGNVTYNLGPMFHAFLTCEDGLYGLKGLKGKKA